MAQPEDETQFTLASAARIGRVVRIVESAVPKTNPLQFDAVLETRRRPVFRVGTFAGSWSLSQVKTVTLLNANTTLPAINIFANIGETTAVSRNCAIAKDGTAWYLIAAQC